jgi:hypothetical protein
MKSIKDLNTAKDVEDLSDDEMYYIDKAMRKAPIDFNNDEVATEFSRQWVIRGILA